MSVIKILEIFKGPKRQLLHFGDDFVIRDLKSLDLKNKYLFDKKKDRAWPLVHELLMPSEGGFPYVQAVTDYGVLDPFSMLSEALAKTVGDGKQIAKAAIREVMHDNTKKSAGHTTALILGFFGAAVFVMLLLVVLLWLKGQLSVT